MEHSICILGLGVINKFLQIISRLCWNSALWLAKICYVTRSIQSGRFISALQSLFLKNGPRSASFGLFLFFSNTIFTEITVGFSGIRTLIIIVEGKHADHLTTSTAHRHYIVTWNCSKVDDVSLARKSALWSRKVISRKQSTLKIYFAELKTHVPDVQSQAASRTLFRLC